VEKGKLFPSQIPDEGNPSITGKGIKNSLQHFPVHCTLHRQIALAYIQHLSANLLHGGGRRSEIENINSF
jgi:hypothetical protein